MSEQVDLLAEKIDEVRNARREKEQSKEFRYDRNAYYFALDLVDYTIGALGKDHLEGEEKHVGCRDLMNHAPGFADAQFGRCANLVLERWRMPTMDDLGEVISDLIEGELLSRRPADSEKEFQTGQVIVKG